MSPELLNQTVVAIVSDLSSEPIEGVVVGISSKSIALRLATPINLPSGETAWHLVASIRHDNRSLIDIAAGQLVLCGIILVPVTQFDEAKPCDVSWWRGGGAGIGDVAAVPSSPPRTPGV